MKQNRLRSHLLVMLILNGIVSYSQTPYQTLDSLSNEIKRIQASANGKLYIDRTGRRTLSFPDANFGVRIANKLAFSAFYTSTPALDVLSLTDSIDLTKMGSLEIFGDGGSDLGFLAIVFREGDLNTQIITAGSGNVYLKPYYLQIFFSNSPENQMKPASQRSEYILFRDFALLRNKLKRDKRLPDLTKDSLALEQWTSIIAKPQTVEGLEHFIAENPNTIFTIQAKKNLAVLREKIEDQKRAQVQQKLFDDEQIRLKEGQKRAEEARKQKEMLALQQEQKKQQQATERLLNLMESRIDSIATSYGYKWNMTVGELIKSDKDVKDLINSRNYLSEGKYERKIKGLGNNYNDGPYSITIVNGVVKEYTISMNTTRNLKDDVNRVFIENKLIELNKLFPGRVMVMSDEKLAVFLKEKYKTIIFSRINWPAANQVSLAWQP